MLKSWIATTPLHSLAATWRSAGVAICLSVAVAGCAGSAAASPISGVAGATATPSAGSSANSDAGSGGGGSGGGSDAGSGAGSGGGQAATSGPGTTTNPVATSHPTTASQATATAAATTQAATPPSAPALCTAAQLSFNSQSWQVVLGVTHISIAIKNVSSTTCTLHSTPETQVFEGSGTVVVDSGPGPLDKRVYTLAPNGLANDVVMWANLCKALTVKVIGIAVVLPSSLGRVAASEINASGEIPTCTAATSPTTLTAQPWAA